MTNGQYEILALVRSHQFNEQIAIKVGEVYPVAFATSLNAAMMLKSSDESNVTGNVDGTEEGAEAEEGIGDTSNIGSGWTWTSFLDWVRQQVLDASSFALKSETTGEKQKQQQQPSSKSSKAKVLTARWLMVYKSSPVVSYGTDIVDHCLLLCGIELGETVSTLMLEAEDPAEEETSRLRRFFDLFFPEETLSEGETTLPMQLQLQLDAPGQKGYLLYQNIDPVPSKAAASSSSASVSTPAITTTTADANAATTGADGAVVTPDPVTEVEDEDQNREYLEFVPRMLLQYSTGNKQCLTYPSFGQAVDEYFCKLEGQRLLISARNTEESITRKIEKVRNEQDGLIQQLAHQQDKLYHSAMSVEVYAEEVDAICSVINSAVASGMSWADIQDMVDREANVNQNPYAKLVHSLQLKDNKITVRLPNISYDEELLTEADWELVDAMAEAGGGISGGKQQQGPEVEVDAGSGAMSNKKLKQKAKQQGKLSKQQGKQQQDLLIESLPLEKQSHLLIEIDLSVSGYANACKLYGNKKQAAAKEQKTILNAEKAVAGVEKAAEKQLNKANVKRHLVAVRKVHWFEKFNWFVTTQGYLCLSGRDAQQNELLVKRYMEPHDAYIHADVAGAASCVVKAKRIAIDADGKPVVHHDDFDGDRRTSEGVRSLSSAGGHSSSVVSGGSGGSVRAPVGYKTIISPIALQEAAVNTICRSIAWDNKIVIAAWWVWGSQVSKTPPTGEYLTTGSFMIYGKKNFLSPSSLEMGFGVMFRLDDAGVRRHVQMAREKQERKEGLSGGGSNGDIVATTVSDVGGRGNSLLDAVTQSSRNSIGAIEEMKTAESSSSSSTSSSSLRALASATAAHATGLNKYGIDYAADLSNDQALQAMADADAGASQTASADGGDGDGNGHGPSSRPVGQVNSSARLTSAQRKALKKQGGKPAPGEAMKTVAAVAHEDENEEAEEEQGDYRHGSNDEEEESGEDEEEEDYSSRRSAANVNSLLRPDKHVHEQRQGQEKSSGSGGSGNKKGQQQKQSKSTEPQAAAVNSKKKEKGGKINRKKARRYAEQDEEDKLLAMQILGHIKLEDTAEGQEQQRDEEEEKEGKKRIAQRQAGMDMLAQFDEREAAELCRGFSSNVQRLLSDIEYTCSGSGGSSAGGSKAQQQSKDKDKDKTFSNRGVPAPFFTNTELKSLASFEETDKVAVLARFKKVLLQNPKNRNKSGLFAKTMNEYSQAREKQQQAAGRSRATSVSGGVGVGVGVGMGVGVGVDEAAGMGVDGPMDSQQLQQSAGLSRRAQKREEQEEIQQILEEEGAADEDGDNSSMAEETDKLTGTPLPEDVLLYAVPVCAPYCVLKDFKYKVKLTPGTQKKGKAVKQAMELFTRDAGGSGGGGGKSKGGPTADNASASAKAAALQKSLIKQLTDPECVALMIGDVKVSTPGLYANQR